MGERVKFLAAARAADDADDSLGIILLGDSIRLKLLKLVAELALLTARLELANESSMLLVWLENLAAVLTVTVEVVVALTWFSTAVGSVGWEFAVWVSVVVAAAAATSDEALSESAAGNGDIDDDEPEDELLAGDDEETEDACGNSWKLFEFGIASVKLLLLVLTVEAEVKNELALLKALFRLVEDIFNALGKNLIDF